MAKLENKILKGSIVRGDALLLPRAIAIYKAALCQNYIEVLECIRRSDCSEIIKLRFSRLSIPDEPVFPISETEDVAIVCTKEDLHLPEVYALRKDFPSGLPHTNARPYIHPVSMCVSDVPFSDMRLQFNAHDFLGNIRRWFNKNSIGELHESDRPMEIYFQTQEFCSLLNENEDNASFVKFEQIFAGCSRLGFTNKRSEATHFYLPMIADVTIAQNMAILPTVMSELKTLKMKDGKSLYESIDSIVANTASRDNSLPILVILFLPERKMLSTSTDRTELFMFRIHVPACEIYKRYRTLRIENPDAYTEWYDNIKISIACLLPPPHLLWNRDCNNKNSNLPKLQKITIVGTGTLGSNIMDSIVRKGICENLAIVDSDVLLPHNVARHVLTPKDVMLRKASSLKKHYSGICGQKIISIDKNYFELGLKEKNILFSEAELILDVSTSIAVERSLALDPIETTCRRSSVFLNPGGNQMVLILEDKNRHCRLDLLEMDFLRQLIINKDLDDYLDDINHLTSNQFTCRSESFIIDYDNVKILASLSSKDILQGINNDAALLHVWTIDKETGESRISSLPISKWQVFSANAATIYVSSFVKNEIEQAYSRNKDNETGGCLFGCYDKDRNIIYVLYAADSPEDSIKSPASFIRGSKGMKELAQKISEKTHFQIVYLGEWHTHPNMSNSPSADDKKQFDVMYGQLHSEDLPFVQGIYGVNGLYVNAKM